MGVSADQEDSSAWRRARVAASRGGVLADRALACQGNDSTSIRSLSLAVRSTFLSTHVRETSSARMRLTAIRNSCERSGGEGNHETCELVEIAMKDAFDATIRGDSELQRWQDSQRHGHFSCGSYLLWGSCQTCQRRNPRAPDRFLHACSSRSRRPRQCSLR